MFIFIVRKLKQATSWSVCAVTYPEILLKHREVEKKHVKCSQADGLYTSKGMPGGVKAEKT